MVRLRSRRVTAAIASLVLSSGASLAQAPSRNSGATGAGARPTATTAATTRTAADAGRPAAEQERRAQIVAQVGETAITVGEFEDMLNEAPAPVRQSYMEPGRRREFLENMIHTLLLADEAHRRGIDRAPEVSSAIRRILAQRLEQTAVLEAITMDSVTDADVRAYYDAHIGDYQQPEFRRATVVYLADRAAAEAVVALARAARGDMRRIQALVAERSVDPQTRDHQGDLFYFRRTGVASTTGVDAGVSPIDPAVSAAAFALAREMEVSPAVQAADGRWAVVVLTGVRPALSRTITDAGVINSIRGFIVRERRSQRQQQLVEQLRARANPEVHEERLDIIYLPPADLGGVPPFDPRQGPPRREPTNGHSPVPSPASPTNPAGPLVAPGAQGGATGR